MLYNINIKRAFPHDLNYLELNNVDRTLIPKIVDLRSKLPPIYDQGNLGSCTANALCTVMEYIDHVRGSRLFLYYNERKLENDIPDDAGAYLIDGIKCLCKYGICDENIWPYDEKKFSICPPSLCYKEAIKHKAITVKNITNDMYTMKQALVQNHIFVVGISIYLSFESDVVVKTGYVPIPSPICYVPNKVSKEN